MYNGLLRAHSGLRWILLILLIATIVTAFQKWKGNKPFEALDNKLSLFTLIFAHIQLLTGLYLYVVSPKVMLKGLDMSNTLMRFFAVEHIFGMIVAIALITIGRVQSKKITEDALKHKKIFVMYLIALVIMLATIPWPFRNLGASWF